jgi:RND family efflux transporter MFP subunit
MSSIHRSSIAAPRRRWFCLLGFVAGTALLGLSGGCHRPAADPDTAAGESEARASEPPKLSVVRPQRKTVRRPIKRPGYNIEAFQSTALFAKIPGYVGKWHFDIGAQVRKGQVMAELSIPEMEVEVQQKEAAVTQAEAEIKQARASVLRAEADRDYRKAQYDRLSRVGRSGVLDRENVDEARFALEAARAVVAKAQADVGVAGARLPVAQKARDYARTLLRYTKILAPFDGVVTKRHINEGDFVQPATGRKGEALFVVDQLDPVRVFVNVPETEAVWVREKDEAAVQSQVHRGRKFRGRVTRTARSLDPTTRTLRTEIDLPNPERQLLPGMYVDVTITPERRDVWVLPESAVVTTEEGSYCYRLENGKAVRTPLQVGLAGGGLVEVVKKQAKAPTSGEEERWEGITGQEEVVSNPAGLSDGQPVRRIESGAARLAAPTK